MATPITWRNVSGSTGGSEAAALLRGAQSSMDGAFTNFDKILKERQANNIANAGVVEENQKQAFLNLMASAKTPDQLAAMQGEIDAAYGGMSTANQAATRDAQAARLATIQGRVIQDRQFQQGETDARNKPLLDQAMAAAAAGDGLGVAAIESANPGLPIAEARKALVAAGYAADKNARDALAAPLDLAHKKAQTEQAEAQAAKLKAEATAAPGELAAKNAEMLQKRLEAAQTAQAADAVKLSKLEGNTIGSDGGIDGVLKELTSVVKDKKQLPALVSSLNGVLASNPAYGSLPSSVVKNIALKQAENTSWFFGDSVNESTLKADLDKALVANKDTDSAAAESRLRLQTNMADRDLNIAGLQDQLYPEYAAKRLASAAANAPSTTPAPAAAQSAEQPRADTPVVTPGSTQRAESARVQQLAKIEQAEKAAGLRKEFTKEVSDYLGSQGERDRKILGDVGSALGTSALSLGNAFNDIFTLPVRAAGGATNTLLRLPNAFGAGIPYIPDEGGVLSSLTPYSDRQRAQGTGNTAVADAKAMRAAFEKEQAELRAKSKKAK